jgi:phage major head subunit gpT-like protein
MEIQRVREAYATLSPVGKVVETGRVKVAREPEEKLQMALDRFFNLPVEDSSIPAFHGIREAYVAYTGDGDVTGLLPTQMRIREDITSTTFSNALANTLRRLLLKEYREQEYGVSLIAQYSSVPDFRTQERVRVGYFGDLPTVATESADYTELTAPTDEKASFSVVTFGGIVTITRKMIINDDLGVVPQIVSRLGRAARRTLAQRVFNLMITNPAIYDSVAWFHASHGNLGSTALAATELDVVRTAMRNRTEKDSNKKLGIAPNVLVVPHELEGKARQENMREYLDSSFTPNPVRFMFGASGERIVVSPLLSDATDWYVFADVNEAPTVEVGFLQGRQEPEFFLADDQTAEKVFTSDKIRYKVRHEFEAAVIDYRGAYKEVVAG